MVIIVCWTLWIRRLVKHDMRLWRRWKERGNSWASQKSYKGPRAEKGTENDTINFPRRPLRHFPWNQENKVLRNSSQLCCCLYEERKKQKQMQINTTAQLERSWLHFAWNCFYLFGQKQIWYWTFTIHLHKETSEDMSFRESI